MRSGQDTLIVWKLDTLARSLVQLIETVNDLQTRDIGFRSLAESIDISSSGGSLIFHIFSSIAEFERDLIRERIMASLDAARKRGKYGGRPKKMNSTAIVQARALMQQGKLPVKEIAKGLAVSVAILYRHL